MDSTVVQDTLDLFPIHAKVGMELKAMEFDGGAMPLEKG